MNSTAVSSEGCTTGEAADRKGCRGRTRDGTGQLSGARSYLGPASAQGPRRPSGRAERTRRSRAVQQLS